MKMFKLRCQPFGGLVCVGLEGSKAVEREASVRVCADGPVLKIFASAPDKMKLTQIKVVLPHVFSEEDRVLMNGFQCWTLTEELSVTDSQQGINMVPGNLVHKYSLDRAGDYLFADYPNKPGRFHGWTYGYVRTPAAPKATLPNDSKGLLGPAESNLDECTLWASLDESTGFTKVIANVAANTVTLEKEVAEVAQVFNDTEIAAFYIGKGDLNEVFEGWFKAMGPAASARTHRPIIGYTSWYRHYENIEQDTLVEDLVGAASSFLELRSEGLIGDETDVLFQIDDGWQMAVGDWDYNPERFPVGMSGMASIVKSAGLIPGLWMAPFAVAEKSQMFADHQDWLVRDAKGKLVRMGDNWGGYYALDLTIADVRAHVSQVIRRAAEWGFGLLKLDFLAIACAEKAKGMTRGSQMSMAMNLLRSAAGPDVRILGCGVPLGSCFGVVEYSRVGCDVGLDWNDKRHMRFAHAERISTKNSLTDAYFRRQLNGRGFLCDPDVFFLRKDGVDLKRKQRALLAGVQASCGGVLLTSDDMGAYTIDEQLQLRELVSAWRDSFASTMLGVKASAPALPEGEE